MASVSYEIRKTLVPILSPSCENILSRRSGWGALANVSKRFSSRSSALLPISLAVGRMVNDHQALTGLVRDAKHPREKIGNHLQFKYTSEGWAIVQAQPKRSPYIFPNNPSSVSDGFTNACQMLASRICGFMTYATKRSVGSSNADMTSMKSPVLAAFFLGGIASPTIANMALDGLEAVLADRFGRTPWTLKQSRVRLVRYCDDFVITGSSQELLENEVKPCVEAFLAERGLELSKEKTLVTHISQGFDFLGQMYASMTASFS